MIDSGNGRKLERVGPYVLDRPEPRAEHSPGLSARDWKAETHARYEEDRNGKRGNWELNEKMPKEWTAELRTQELALKAHCGLGNSKHYGFFPEQAVNWDLLHQRLKGIEGAKALLLFAYTGIASLACKRAGADTFHVESSKPTLSKARKNMELNGLSDIRWVLEDAMKFAQREARRGHRYHAIVLDPPTFGRGPNGELWKAGEGIPELFETCAGLLHSEEQLLIANLYTEELPMEDLQERVEGFCEKEASTYELHDLYIPSDRGKGISAGGCLRLRKNPDRSR